MLRTKSKTEYARNFKEKIKTFFYEDVNLKTILYIFQMGQKEKCEKLFKLILTNMFRGQKKCLEAVDLEKVAKTKFSAKETTKKCKYRHT